MISKRNRWYMGGCDVVQHLEYQLGEELRLIGRALTRMQGVCIDCASKEVKGTKGYSGYYGDGRCCCNDCRGTHGYLMVSGALKGNEVNQNGLYRKEVEEIEKVYGFERIQKEGLVVTPGEGFHGVKGCKLPRALRSITCQIYICPMESKRYTQLELDLFGSLIHHMGDKRVLLLQELRKGYQDGKEGKDQRD